jgi:hypothetical protein
MLTEEILRSRLYSRREWLGRSSAGFGLLALADLLAAESDRTAQPFAVRPPHHAAKAKRVIFLYMPGGPSHVDLFDPKPRLLQDNGKPLPFETPKLERVKPGNIFASPWKFSQHGQSGTPVSELLPETAACIDDICVIRSMVADNINHSGAALQMCTGEQAFSRPSLGSWLTYGLGTVNQNLPGFVVVSPAAVFQGAQLWSSSFLPGAYQGTLIRDLKNPIANLGDPSASPGPQRVKLDALQRLNDIHKRGRLIDSELNARIASFELAFRMQREAPEAFDLAQESPATHQLYGTDKPATEMFGRQCLMARRLVERGVRFVQHLRCTRQQRLGSSQQDSGEPAQTLRRRGQAHRLPAARPQVARASGGHTRALGRRVRPHAHRRGWHRPRASSLRLHDVDGRRRREGRHGARSHR